MNNFRSHELTYGVRRRPALVLRLAPPHLLRRFPRVYPKPENVNSKPRDQARTHLSWGKLATSETRNPEPEARNSDPGTRNPEPGTRNPNHTVGYGVVFRRILSENSSEYPQDLPTSLRCCLHYCPVDCSRVEYSVFKRFQCPSHIQCPSCGIYSRDSFVARCNARNLKR